MVGIINGKTLRSGAWLNLSRKSGAEPAETAQSESESESLEPQAKPEPKLANQRERNRISPPVYNERESRDGEIQYLEEI